MKNRIKFLSAAMVFFCALCTARAQPNYIDNIVVTGTSSLSGVLTNSTSETVFNTLTLSSGSITRLNSGATLSLAGTVTGSAGVIPSSLISGLGSNAISLLITGSASPAANSASLSMASGTTITTRGNGTISLSGSGVNLFSSITSSNGIFSTGAGGEIQLQGAGDIWTLTGTGTIVSLGGAQLTYAGDVTLTGSGALSFGGFTGTLPATGTFGLLGNAQTWTAAQTISASLNIHNGTVTTSITGASISANFSNAANIEFNPLTATNSNLGNNAYNNIKLHADGVRELRAGISGSGVGGASGAYLFTVGVPLYLYGNSVLMLTLSNSTATFASGTTVNTATHNSTVTSMSSARVGAGGTQITGIIRSTVTLSSGAGTITNSAITATTVAVPVLRTQSQSGTVGIAPGVTYFTGSLSLLGTATDNSAYDVMIFVQ